MAAASGSNAPIISDALVAWPAPPSRSPFSATSPPQTARQSRFSLASPPTNSYPTFTPVQIPSYDESASSGTYTSPKGKARALPLTIDVEVDLDDDDHDHGAHRQHKAHARRLDYGAPRRPLTPAQLGRIAQSFGIMSPNMSLGVEASSSSAALRSARPRSPGGTTLLSVPTQNLVVVVPPPILLALDDDVDPTENRERLRRFRRGRLLPVQPTLGAMLALIAREFGLPSILGVNVYLGANGGAVREELLGSRSSSSSSDDDDTGPLITAHTWTSLFAHVSRSTSPGTPPSTTPRKPKGRSPFGVASPLSASPLATRGDSIARGPSPGADKRRANATSIDEPPPFRTSQGSSSGSSFSPYTPGSSSLSPVAQMPVFGTIEFEVDPTEARWLNTWLKAGGPMRRRAASDTVADHAHSHSHSVSLSSTSSSVLKERDSPNVGIRHLTLVQRLKDERPKFLRDIEERERAVQRALEAEREAKALAVIAAKRAAQMEELRRRAEEERMAEEARLRAEMEAEAEAEEQRLRAEAEAAAEEARLAEIAAEEQRRVEAERLRLEAEAAAAAAAAAAEQEQLRLKAEAEAKAMTEAEAAAMAAAAAAAAAKEQDEAERQRALESSDEEPEAEYAALEDDSDGSDYSEAPSPEVSTSALPLEDPLDDLASFATKRTCNGPLSELDIGTDRALTGPLEEIPPSTSQDDLRDVAALLNAVDANPEVLSDPSLASPTPLSTEQLASPPLTQSPFTGASSKPPSAMLLASPFMPNDSRLASPISLPTRGTTHAFPSEFPVSPADSSLPLSPNGPSSTGLSPGVPTPALSSPALAHLRQLDKENDLRASGQLMEDQLNSLERMMRDLSPREIEFSKPFPTTSLPSPSSPPPKSPTTWVNELPPRGSSRLPYLQPDDGRLSMHPAAPRSVSEPMNRPTASAPGFASPPPIPYKERDARAGHVPRTSGTQSTGSHGGSQSHASHGGSLGGSLGGSHSASVSPRDQLSRFLTAALPTTSVPPTPIAPPRPARPPTPDLSDLAELVPHTLPPVMASALKHSPGSTSISIASNVRSPNARPPSMSLRGLKRQVSKTVLPRMDRPQRHGEPVGLFPRQPGETPPSSFGSMREREVSGASADGDENTTLRSRLFSFGARRKRESQDERTISHISAPIAASHKNITPAELAAQNPGAYSAALTPATPLASASTSSLTPDPDRYSLTSPSSPRNVRRKPVPSIEGGSVRGSAHENDLEPVPSIPQIPAPLTTSA